MVCPNCKSRLTVTDTRPNYQNKPEVYRRLICKNCGEWYFSEEKLKSIPDKEFMNKWKESTQYIRRKKTHLEKIIHDVSDVEEN